MGLLMLTGCSSAPKLERIGVQVKELTSTTSGTMITLRFINPNNVPLVVPGSEHTLYLNGTLVGFIKNRKALGIPPLGTVTESIALFGDTAKSAGHFIADHPGSAAYTLESTLRLNWNDDIYNYKTSDQGHVTLNPTSVAP